MISVTEDEFTAVAVAAAESYDRGDIEHAKTLDKLARKINASLSNKTVNALVGPGMRTTGKASWKDMPPTTPEDLHK